MKAALTFVGGIGPADQLRIVNNSRIDGPTMISSDQWINLPVGYNLNDHVGVSSMNHGSGDTIN
jgi:cellobiose dehydrogenase (acceptor)